MAVVHLVHGFVASGKTTFARELAAREDAILLSIDAWYLRLFTDVPTHHIDFEAWERLQGQLEDLWIEIARHGVDVVLDWGFWRRRERDRVRRLAAANGFEVRLWALHCPDDVARRRCAERAGRRGTFLIDEAGYDEMRSRFEPLGEDEPHTLIETA